MAICIIINYLNNDYKLYLLENLEYQCNWHHFHLKTIPFIANLRFLSIKCSKVGLFEYDHFFYINKFICLHAIKVNATRESLCIK